MRASVRPWMLLCSLSASLAACNEDTPTSASAAATQPAFATTAASSCDPATSPKGIVDKVDTPEAWGVAVRDDGLAYFAEPFLDGVGITSTRTRTVDGFIATDLHPIGVAFSPDGSTAYVTNLFSNTVSVLNVSLARQVASISTGDASPFVVRVSPDGQRLFIATNGTTVLIVDTSTLLEVGRVEVGDAPNAFAVHPDGRIMYVSSFFGGTVTEMDMFTGLVLRTFPVGGVPQDMAVNKKGDRLYVANEAGYLNEVDLFTGQMAPPIALPGGGFGIGVTPNDKEAYVSIPSMGLVQVFTLQSRKLTRSIAVGGEPRRLAFSHKGGIGAIANMAGYITFVR
jgi:YVTN family beta-propeller protein